MGAAVVRQPEPTMRFPAYDIQNARAASKLSVTGTSGNQVRDAAVAPNSPNASPTLRWVTDLSGKSNTDRRARTARTSPDRVQRSFYLPRDLVDRARAAVWATMREEGEAYNVSELAGRALEAEVRRLEERYNDGKPFPAVDSVPSGPSPAGVERIRAGARARRRRH